MATKLILSLFLSLFFISQVSSNFRSNEEEQKALHVFNRGGDRKLMQSIELSILKYYNNHLSNTGLAPAPTSSPSPSPSRHLDCGESCKNRCSLHSRQNLCMRACGTCCVRCKCVPPGTFGNREMCGKCYTDMTTHQNKTKCP